VVRAEPVEASGKPLFASNTERIEEKKQKEQGTMLANDDLRRKI
jgi:hypothetical protein